MFLHLLTTEKKKKNSFQREKECIWEDVHDTFLLHISGSTLHMFILFLMHMMYCIFTFNNLFIFIYPNIYSFSVKTYLDHNYISQQMC